MKLKIITLTLFLAAGFGASYAVAGNGHGKPGDPTTAGGSPAGKVTICHRAGHSGRWIKIAVSRHALKAHRKDGDGTPDAQGNCPAPAGKPAGTSKTEPAETEQAETTDKAETEQAETTDEADTEQAETTDKDETDSEPAETEPAETNDS
jgi:hypothetical protein